MEKQANGLPKLDPAVQALLENSSQRVADRQLSPTVRKSKRKAREKQAERNGSRAVYDMDVEIIRKIQRLAEQNSTSASQVAQLGLHLFLQAVDRGDINLTEYRIPIQSPRYDNKLGVEKTIKSRL